MTDAARTMVLFHAHPDDESIGTAGVMKKAAEEGHRVVLVLATKGEHGEVDDGFLDVGEELWQRRVKEVGTAAEILGVARVEFLGYIDSGMADTPENDKPDSFWQANLDEAAGRLAEILREEKADILTVYDDNGLYGHPDHIQVHRVGVKAGELAGTRKIYESTVNRDHMQRIFRMAQEGGLEGEMPEDLGEDSFQLGVSEALITTTVDVRPWLDVKRAAMAAHASQINETSFFLSMPREQFELGFGQEWFILRGAPPGTNETDLFEGLE
jgi:LmbE family N-acetylglucosaminyl deacetylase